MTKEADNICQSIKNKIGDSGVPMVLHVIVWADDFEVNRIKKKHGS